MPESQISNPYKSFAVISFSETVSSLKCKAFLATLAFKNCFNHWLSPGIECGFPAVIAHGGYSLLNGSVAYLSHVQYSCKPGYEMAGRARLVCDIDERWNGPPPRCEGNLQTYKLNKLKY